MKVSIIIPVYNEEETIGKCLDALLSQDYPKEDYEIITVDDGSTDRTREIVRKYPVRLIELKENRGRTVARETGALAATYNLLFFVDSRVIAEQDVLKTACETGYQPLAAGDWNERDLKYRSPYDTLFYLLRKRIYNGYYPQCEYPDKMPFYYINEVNFDGVPKGLGGFLVEKELFLSSLCDYKGKDVSDDTKILREMVRRKDIMRHSGIRLTYMQRTGFWEVMMHIYGRGPKFADYYLKKGGRYRKAYMLALLAVTVILAAAVLKPKLLLTGLAISLTLYLASAFWLSESFRDVVVVSVYLLPIAAAFSMGILRGLLFASDKEVG